MTRIKWTLEKVKEAIKEIHGDVITIDESTFIRVDRKCKFIDKEYGEWETTPNHLIRRKQGHKARGLEKAKNIWLEKYGVDNPTKSKEIIEKRKNTCLERFGAIAPLKNIEVLGKSRATLMSNYGVTIPFKSKEIRDKAENTCLERFGCLHPAQNSEVVRKMETTNMLRYGVKYAMKNHEIATRSAKNVKKSVVLKHWKTGEELVCVSSWEVKVAEHLNANKIEFQWQHETFTMPDERTYRPDLYLTQENKWIEIKGYFRKDAEEKWNWFHKEHLNSELWDKTKLKKLKIL